MFSIYENNKKISGACRSFVLCLDYVAISPFIYFKEGAASEHEDCYGTFKKLLRNSEFSKSDNFKKLQYLPKFLVSHKKYVYCKSSI